MKKIRKKKKKQLRNYKQEAETRQIGKVGKIRCGKCAKGWVRIWSSASKFQLLSSIFLYKIFLTNLRSGLTTPALYTTGQGAASRHGAQ